MTDERATPDPARLLAEGEWARRLAHTLVRDAARADDLAQDVLLAAWRAGSPPRGRAGLRAWLARALRHRAWRQRAADAHRRAREERASRAESVRSTDEVVERAATQQRVVEAVLALDEPLRTVVLLRAFDGLSNARVAERLGISREAARKRWSRGLAVLRLRLAGGRGGAGALALLAGIPRRGAPALVRTERRARRDRTRAAPRGARSVGDGAR